MAINDLTVDLDLKQNLNVYTVCKQSDDLTLICNIYDNSVQAGLANYNVRLVAMKSDNIPLVQEHTGITLLNNIVRIEADSQLTTTSGKTLIELQFNSKITGKRKATFNLVLNVVPSALEVNTSISTATYTLLQELENKLDQAGDYLQNIDQAIELNNELTKQNSNATSNMLGLNTQNTNATKNISDLMSQNNDATPNISNLEIQNTNAETNIEALKKLGDVTQLAQDVTNIKTEIQTARGTESNLDARLDKVDASLSDKANPNLLINGDFQVWQRDTSFNSAGVYYSADRWKIDAGGGTNSVTKQYDTTVGNFIRISTNQYANLWHQIEQADLDRLKGKKVTLSFYARKVSGNFVNAVYRVSNVSDVVNNNANNFTTEWKKFTITTTIPTDATALNLGLVNFYTGQNGNVVVYDIAQVKLEIGSTATPFIPRLYAEELDLCERYYEKSYYDFDYAGAKSRNSGIFVGQFQSGVLFRYPFSFKTRKRVVPTVSIYSTENGTLGSVSQWNYSNGQSSDCTATASDIATTGVGRVEGMFASGCSMISFQWIADAEIY